jgi:pseudouridine-5'-phosphate glycosidase
LELERWIGQALDDCANAGITGKAVTPFLLSRLSELSNGVTLTANKALLVDNAQLAAKIAIAYAHTLPGR